MTDPGVTITMLGGNCPVQAEGTIYNVPFYFRARGKHWSLGIGADPVVAPDWFMRRQYSDEEYAAGWIEEHEALEFIALAVAAFRAGAPTQGGHISTARDRHGRQLGAAEKPDLIVSLSPRARVGFAPGIASGKGSEAQQITLVEEQDG